MTARTTRTTAGKRAALLDAARKFGVPVTAVPVTRHETPLDYVRTVEAEHVPPPDWVRELREVSPESTVVPYLNFHWLEGTERYPVQRWVLYSYIPSALIPEGMHALLGAEPYWALPAHRQAGRRQMVSALQWHLYQTKRVWARPFWCLQGEEGGTPAQYGELEQKLLQMLERPTEPPPPGALPYAAWDARVARAVRRRDKLVQFGGRLAALEQAASSDGQKAEYEAMMQAFRKEFVSWYEDRIAPQADMLTWLTRRTEADALLRRATREEAHAADRAVEQYVETGLVS